MDNIVPLVFPILQKANVMNVQISNRVRSLCLAIKTFVVSMSDDMKHSNVDLRFSNEVDSMNAFTALKEMGVKCYHAGKNAPNGASVMVYNCDRNDFQLKIYD